MWAVHMPSSARLGRKEQHLGYATCSSSFSETIMRWGAYSAGQQTLDLQPWRMLHIIATAIARGLCMRRNASQMRQVPKIGGSKITGRQERTANGGVGTVQRSIPASTRASDPHLRKLYPALFLPFLAKLHVRCLQPMSTAAWRAPQSSLFPISRRYRNNLTVAVAAVLPNRSDCKPVLKLPQRPI